MAAEVGAATALTAEVGVVLRPLESAASATTERIRDRICIAFPAFVFLVLRNSAPLYDAWQMCGRYVSPEQAAIERAFAVTMPLFDRSYNVAPTQTVPVVRLREGKREGV